MENEKNPKQKKLKAAPDSITGITVSGYKSIIKPQSIEIRPLTVLAGANSSGKSSIIQPLLLLKQTLDAPYDPGPLLLEGPNVTFTSADQFFSRVGDGHGRKTFEVGVNIGLDASLTLSFKRHPEKGLDIQEMNFSDGSEKGTLRPGMTSAELEAAVSPAADLVAELHDMGKVELSIYRKRCFLEIVAEVDRLRLDVPLPSGRLARHLSRLIHLPGLRGNPERTYLVTGVGSRLPGTFEKYVATVIARWQGENGSRLQALNQALESIGLTWKVRAEPVAETRVELRVGRLAHGRRGGSQDLVSIADVGFGVSQTLPVLVALLLAEPGQAVYLEQPEIHLHPKAQTRMARVLADAAIRGVRVIVETHSSLLLRAIQTLVASGELAPEIVKLYWFTRKPKDGSTEIHSADLDRQGAFGDWPEDFDEVTLEAEKQYLDAAEVSGKH